MKKPLFIPGDNIALKVPSDEFNNTVAFYRDVLGLKIVRSDDCESIAFDFGSKTLWVDNCPALSRSEIWLEIRTSNPDDAAKVFEAEKITRRDDIEALPPDMHAFWIKSPSGTIHLISENEEGTK